MNARQFFAELRRRNVYKVAVAYAVVAWLLMQVASQIFPFFEIPNWAVRLVVLLLVIGFPVALILAWAFELTPEGIKRAEVADATRRPSRGRAWIYILVIGAALSVSLFFLGRYTAQRTSLAESGRPPAAAGFLPGKSIAVLPFENLSADPENAYFAGGIQDDILTNLAKIGDLKVISRTSVAKYKSNAANIREIGEALGVAAVLEGSVRRAGNRVRISVQLIDTSTDTHIWADDFDRELTDIFAIQSDVAFQIASVLQAKLSPAEKARLKRKPTESGPAYLLYLQALDQFRRRDLKQAETSFEKAVEADPSFALALARLSELEGFLYINIDPVPDRLEKARATANEALRLQPNLPEAHLALGRVYVFERDYEHALAELTIAKKDLPNDPVVFISLGSAIIASHGNSSQAIADYQKATALDPKDGRMWVNLANAYSHLRQFPAAMNAIDRACAVEPRFKLFRAELYINWKGELNALDQLFTGAPETADSDRMTPYRFQLKLLQRKYGEAVELLTKSPLDHFAVQWWREWRGATAITYPKSLLLAEAYGLGKDSANARLAFEAARTILENSVRENPNDAAQHALLGYTYAGLGRREDAIREGKRAVELLPESRDAIDGPAMTVGLARIYTTLGDIDSALPLLEHSLSSMGGATPALLRLDPAWDPLRQDRRFEKLLAKFDASSPKS